MTENRQFPERIAIVRALRQALGKCAHHQTFTKRLRSFIETELPGCTVYIHASTNPMGLNELSVWGNGLLYENRVHLSWSVSKPWVSAFEEALDIADDTDYVERQEMEARVLSSGRLDELQKRIIAIQKEAAHIFEQMLIPRSATIRAAAHFWDKPSLSLQQKFDKLFP